MEYQLTLTLTYTGSKSAVWFFEYYIQHDGGFCVINSINNIVHFNATEYAHMKSFGAFCKLPRMIYEAQILGKGKYKFLKVPTGGLKCFCSLNVYRCSCLRTHLVNATSGKFVVQSENHCYSWDSDNGVVLDASVSEPQKISINVFKTLEISSVYYIYEVEFLNSKFVPF